MTKSTDLAEYLDDRFRVLDQLHWQRLDALPHQPLKAASTTCMHCCYRALSNVFVRRTHPSGNHILLITAAACPTRRALSLTYGATY